MQPRSPSVAGARDPAYASDGRLALSVRGDLWVVSTDAKWTRVTAGPAWDREPAWSADGKSLVCSRRIAAATSTSGALRSVTPAPRRAPTRVSRHRGGRERTDAGRDGRILFVRGRGSAARIWIREPRRERASPNERHARRALAGDLARRTTRVAFVVAFGDGRRLVVRRLVAAGRAARRRQHCRRRAAASSIPPGRLTAIDSPTRPPTRDAVSTSCRSTGATRISSARGTPSRCGSPTGGHLTLVELPDDEVDYNGDPDRLGDREAHDLLSDAGGMWTVDAPAAPDAGSRCRAGSGERAIRRDDERARHNAAALDELAARTATLYYDTPGAAAAARSGKSLVDKYRPRAVARTDRRRAPRRAARPAARASAVSSSRRPGAPRCRARIPSRRRPASRCCAKGGNVVDAAVAVSFALGVVEPDASGPGGYGQMLVYRTDHDASRSSSSSCRVCRKTPVSETRRLLQNGRLPDDGPVLANVPGTVAAMYLAVKKYGSKKMPWDQILAPAIRAARDGYVVSEGLATTLATEREHFLKYDGTRALFFRDGQPLHAGDTLKNPDLAWTLEQIAKGGADAFYRGEIARRIVTDLRGKGNAMKLTDLGALLRRRARAGGGDVSRTTRSTRARRRSPAARSSWARSISSSNSKILNRTPTTPRRCTR